MIKYIIHVGDIHIMNHKRLDEYQVKLQWLINKCKEFCKTHDSSEMRIVITGDLVHNKTELSPECYATASWFLNQLDHICKTIVLAGNHDMIDNNDRLDPLSTIFSMCDFKQTYYIDKETNYQSGCIIDDNIVWCNFSIFDNFLKPNIDEIKIQYPSSVYVGLYHGEITSARTDTDYETQNGLNPSYFDGLNFVLMGHIHKRQCIKYDGMPLVYCGSLVQRDFGENLSKHGFLIWDVEDETYQEVDYNEDTYGFYTFQISGENDIDNDEEEILNL